VREADRPALVDLPVLRDAAAPRRRAGTAPAVDATREDGRRLLPGAADVAPDEFAHPLEEPVELRLALELELELELFEGERGRRAHPVQQPLDTLLPQQREPLLAFLREDR
jgi:hypothetical protein